MAHIVRPLKCHHHHFWMDHTLPRRIGSTWLEMKMLARIEKYQIRFRIVIVCRMAMI
jgi:hypothetical protein